MNEEIRKLEESLKQKLIIIESIRRKYRECENRINDDIHDLTELVETLKELNNGA